MRESHQQMWKKRAERDWGIGVQVDIFEVRKVSYRWSKHEVPVVLELPIPDHIGERLHRGQIEKDSEWALTLMLDALTAGCIRCEDRGLEVYVAVRLHRWVHAPSILYVTLPVTTVRVTWMTQIPHESTGEYPLPRGL